MSRKKRQTLTIIILCILLVLMGGGYYLLIRHQVAEQKKEEEQTEEAISLNEMAVDSIEHFSYQRGKTSLGFRKKDSKWSMEEDASFPLDMTRIENMLGEVAEFTADQLVNDACEDLSEYSLDAPELVVDAEDSEGNTVHIAVGPESMSGGGRYAYCNDSSRIYLVSTSLYTSFDYDREQLMDLPQMPSVTGEQVTYFRWKSRKGRNFEASYDETNSEFKNADSWSIDQPYSQAVAGDQEKLKELFANLEGLTLSAGAEYHCSKAQLKKYGLDDPVGELLVKYSDGEKDILKTLRLSVGKSSGEGHYVKLGGDKGVYIMEDTSLDAILELTPLEYVYGRLYAGNGNDLESMELDCNHKKYEFTVKETKNEEDEEGGTTLVVKKNGSKVSADEFSTAYAAICNLAPVREIDFSVKPVSEKPVATFLFHEKKKDVPVVIYPYDGNNFYRVKVENTMQFLVDMRTIDNIIKDFAHIE